MKKVDFIHYSQIKRRTFERRLAKTSRIHLLEIAVFLFILTIFGLKITGYLHTNIFNPVRWVHGIEHQYDTTSHTISKLKYFGKCPEGEKKIVIRQQYLCRTPTPSSVYQKIYDTYPLEGKGREITYPSIDNGSVKKANDLLQNKVDIERFNTYSIGHAPKWTEDPYHDRYWRFNYYALRPLSGLLYASRTTNNPAYTGKLIELTDSFIDNGMKQPNAWEDYHAVAFRTMILTDIWWKLRAENALSVSDSTKILKALQVHGNFLADRNHYQPGHNHGTNEAAALNLVAVSMPDLPGASNWKHIAIDRVNSSLDNLVDSDGVLIENSPYYHFYTLQKYWDLYHYAQSQHEQFGKDFEDKINKMINYSTYILEPNSHIPLLGASLDTTINSHDEYAQMAHSHPEFEYVLSHGTKGKQPSQTSVFYKTTGQTIMRSGWSKGSKFVDQTQLTFDVGPYRTSHSDLDGLSLTLYGNGKELLPDSGLFTYAAGPMRDYFHGTSSHNTITVDGKDQVQGSPSASQLVQKDGYTYQSAQHQLYYGVTHERSILMLDKQHIVVVDKMLSHDKHQYQQLFHLFPGAKLTKNGLTVTGSGNNKNQSVTISQLNPTGLSEMSTINQTSPKPNGLCSEQYGKAIPCYAVSYNQTASDATYVTLLTIGQEKQKANIQFDNKTSTLHVKKANKKIDFKLSQGQFKSSFVKASSPKAPPADTSGVTSFNTLGNWQADPAGGISPGSEAVSFMTASTRAGETETKFTNNVVKLDLSHKNIVLRVKVKDRPDLKKFDLAFSNNAWQNSATDDLLNDYRTEYDGEWLSVSLGKGMLRDRNGHWIMSAGNFDWSKIDGVRLTLKGGSQHAPQLLVGGLSTQPEQKKGKVVIIFDDGYDSILPAADYLRKNNLKANVAVISKYVVTPSTGHLSLSDLKTLQNKYGWDMVNHTSQHEDAIETYYKKTNMTGYERDVLTGAKFLKDNNLDSAPNWFVYPHGATNATIKQVIAKYYKFARTTINDTEVYPFADPYGVKTMSVQNAGDGEDSNQVATTTDQIARSVSDTKTYGNTLFLTFHRIHSTASDRPGYELSDFKKVVDNIKQQGVEVDTLNDLDKSNGVSSNRLSFNPGIPAQINVDIKIHRNIISEIQYIESRKIHAYQWLWSKL